jgi:hypothetical protein
VYYNGNTFCRLAVYDTTYPSAHKVGVKVRGRQGSRYKVTCYQMRACVQWLNTKHVALSATLGVCWGSVTVAAWCSVTLRSAHFEFPMIVGCTVVQAGSRRPLTAEARVRYQVSPCGVRGRWICTRKGFSPIILFFPLSVTGTGISRSVQWPTRGWTVRGTNPFGGKIFRNRPDWLWRAPGLLCSGYRFSSVGVNRPRRGVGCPPHLAPRLKKA